MKYNTPVLFTTSKALLGDTVFSATVAEQEVTDTEGAIIFTINVCIALQISFHILIHIK